MHVGSILVVIVAPAAFWVTYLYYKDRRQPEPAWALALAYALGIGAALLCLGAYDLAEALGVPANGLDWADTDPLRFLLYSLGVIGALEETAKLLPFVLIVMRLRPFDERIDGVIYASVIGLGFASYENLLFMSHLDGVALYGRAFASPLVHTLFSSIWGLAIARARLSGRPLFFPIFVGLGAAALLHGLYDFAVMAAHPLWRPIPPLLILALWIWRILVFKRLDQDKPT